MEAILINNIRNIAVMLLQIRESIEAGAPLNNRIRHAVTAAKYQMRLLDAVLESRGSDAK